MNVLDFLPSDTLCNLYSYIGKIGPHPDTFILHYSREAKEIFKRGCLV